MNTKELFDLIKTRERVCKSIDCQDCPLKCGLCGFDRCENIDELEYLIRTVKEWAREHPERSEE